MPPRERAGGGPGRFHGGWPSREPTTLASAVALEATVRDARLEVEVRNRVPHNMPGERHFRELDLEIVGRDATGTVTFREQAEIKRYAPFRGERRDDQIRAGASFRAAWRLDEPHGTAEVRLRYKRFYYLPWAEATVIAEREVRW